MTPGIHRGLSNEAYHSGPGLSFSGLKRFRRSPFHYWAQTQPRDVREVAPTAAILNGTLTHCAALEPAEFERRYVVAPEIRRGTNAWATFVAEHPGLTPITQTQRDLACAQADALRTIPDIDEALSRGEAELSSYWIDPETGVLCKCRPDWVTPAGNGDGCVLIDVKTTQDASYDGFGRSVLNYGYHLQAAWYMEGFARASGLEVHGFVFACVESEFPHAAAAYQLDETALDHARRIIRETLHQYANCEREGYWPSYPKEVQPLSLPAWGLRD